jgi:hypothetical protein
MARYLGWAALAVGDTVVTIYWFYNGDAGSAFLPRQGMAAASRTAHRRGPRCTASTAAVRRGR